MTLNSYTSSNINKHNRNMWQIILQHTTNHLCIYYEETQINIFPQQLLKKYYTHFSSIVFISGKYTRCNQMK